MSIKIFLAKYKSQLFVTFFILFLIRILFLQYPLFKNLDLEISIIFALLVSVLSSFSGLYFLKKKERLSHIVVSSLLILVLLYFIFLLIELIFLACPLTQGILFFPIFGLTAFSFGMFLALLVKSIDGIKSFITLFIIIMILLVYSLIEYYYEPQLFLYNPLIIFFPGLVYNEIFEFDLRTIIYVLVLIISFSVVISYHLLLESSLRNFSGRFDLHFKIIPFLSLCLLFLASEKIGLNTSISKLKSYFPIKIEKENFVLYLENPNQNYYKQKIYASTIDFHFKSLKNLTGYIPSRLEIFVFKNDKTKKELLGDEVADFTKPWLNQIFVTENSFGETIKHELAHIFLGEASDNIFKVAGKFNLGLIEGGAMALEWEWLEKSPAYYLALIKKYIGNFNWNDFFKNYSFATKQSSISYLFTGSFCKYLIDKYGFKKFSSFYRTGDFEFSYGKSHFDEFQSFINSLNKFHFSEEDSLKALSLFGGSSFFEKRCPRALARVQKRALKLLMEKDYSKSERLFLQIFEKRKDIDAFSNLLRLKFYQKKYDEVVKLYESSEFRDKIMGIGSIRLKINYALSLIKENRFDEASKIFKQLKNLNLSSSWNSYIEMISILLDFPNYIETIGDNPIEWFNELLKLDFPQKWIVWKNFIENVSSNELEVIVQNSSNDFWILRKCFYRYLELGNFVMSQKIIDLIKSNKLVINEVERYQFDLMNFIIKNLNKKEL